MKARIRIPNPGTTMHIIRGARIDEMNVIPKDLAVRITSDAHGKSMSISDDEGGLMLMIPLEPIIERLKEILK